ALTGKGTNWIAGQTTASFGGEINVDSLTVTGPTSATAQVTISGAAALGPRTVTLTTGTEVIAGVDAFTVNAVSPPGAASSTVSTLAGSAGAPGFTDGTGAAARFRQLAGLAAAPNDVVYVADAGNHAIRRVDASGVVTTIAGYCRCARIARLIQQSARGRGRSAERRDLCRRHRQPQHSQDRFERQRDDLCRRRRRGLCQRDRRERAIQQPARSRGR